MTFRLDEETLREALLLGIEERMEQIPPEAYVPHRFSPKFHHRIKALSKQAARLPVLNLVLFLGKRVCVVLLVLMMVSFTTIMSVEARRVKFFRLIEERFPAYSIVSFEGQSEAPALSHENFRKYIPTAIPEGFHIVEYDATRDWLTIEYEDEQGNRITYHQQWIDEASAVLNSEGVEMRQMKMNDCDAQYFSNIGFQVVLWDNDIYFFSVVSNLDENTVIDIAKSTKIVG